MQDKHQLNQNQNQINMEKEFIEKLYSMCLIYKLMGRGTYESPMWLQLSEIDRDKNLLIFRNSQKQSLWFSIPFNWEGEPFNELYDKYKYLKYKYIQENEPTIFEEIQGTQKANINLFLINNQNQIKTK